jgi:ribosomal protein S18 acetylase RimI-like enzyme
MLLIFMFYSVAKVAIFFGFLNNNPYFCTMEIRKATLKDCQLIHEMAWKVFPETYKDILSEQQNDYMMDWMYSIANITKQMQEEHHTYLIAYHHGQPAGYVSVQPQGKDLWHLQKIYVLPDYQKSGAGSFLFQQAIHYIKEVHPEPCTLELNVNRNNVAVGFYEHMGMHKDRSGDFDIGNGFQMNDYIMAMEI